MKNRDVFQVNEKYHQWLTQMGLMSFEQLMFNDIGCKIDNRVRRIEGCGKVVYLKRQFNTSIYKSIEKYLQGQYPHSKGFNEYTHIRFLQQAQMPVMDPIATGERRKLGFPRCGFILVEEVKGVLLDKCLNELSIEAQKTALLQAFGRLLARLHQNGFYASLRFKDIIVTDVNESSLVMIDRETRRIYPRYYQKIKAKISLNKSLHRIKRTFRAFDDHYMNIILEAYKSVSLPGRDEAVNR
ncbi:MAG: hypothetical protein A2Y10_12680 [Planctomycetes bacterium GWF2_41_51]|nr:MAG: hypothetical protein A2Y10_12680 [Planctomycetes bacterium GWF2_41_51]HBG28618.1 hypothetical protein [Phycisphaerales bacterium]